VDLVIIGGLRTGRDSRGSRGSGWGS